MNNTHNIKSLEDLRLQQLKTRERLQYHEADFKKKFQQLPGELAVASANNFIPRFLRGKVTDTALSGGKFLIDKFFVAPEQGNTINTGLQIKKSGVIPFVKTVFRMFKNRK
jgi:hypothetical protein